MTSCCYDDLLAAEPRATKTTKEVLSKKEHPIHRVADISGLAAATDVGVAKLY